MWTPTWSFGDDDPPTDQELQGPPAPQSTSELLHALESDPRLVRKNSLPPDAHEPYPGS